MNKVINICFSTDDRFAELCTVAMISIAIHTRKENFLQFYIIDNGILLLTKKRMIESLKQYNAAIIFLNGVNIEKVLGTKIYSGEWPIDVIKRLFICKLVPQSIDKILYLDSDILVRNSLDNLYSINIDNYYAAAVRDCISDNVKKNIGISKCDEYFNSGIILINLKKWRKNNIEEEFLSFLQQHLGKLQYIDQDIFNGVLTDKVKVLHPKYNVMTAMFNYSREDLMFYHDCSIYHSKEEFDEALNDPIIVHFSSDLLSVRPWYKNGKHKYRDEWLDIRNKTCWKYEPLWKNDEKEIKKVKRKIYKILPKTVGLYLARIVHMSHVFKYR